MNDDRVRLVRHDVRLAASEFYWAVLDTSNLSAPGLRSTAHTARLGFLFESTLPEPIEGVHAAYRTIVAGHVLACAMPRERLKDQHGDAISLGPSEAPSFVAEWLASEHGPLDVTQLARSINLLTGDYEPPAVRRLKLYWSFQATIILTLCTLLIAISLERRTQAARSSVTAMHEHTQYLHQRALGDATATGQDPSARLLSELRRLRAASEAQDQLQAPQDVSIVLASVLDQWPSGVAARASNVQLTADRVMITALLPDNARAEQLERSLSLIDGWVIGQRSFRPARDGVELRLPLMPIEVSTP